MLLDDAQAGLLAARQVGLGDVAGDDDLGAEAEPGQEHLHLLGRGVLRLVEDDERVVERAAAHERQRRDLDGPGRHQLGDQLGVEHVVQRVVQRAQVGVDLLGQRAGQEAEPLAGLDRRAAEDDPVDLLGLQRLHGLGDREVGLAGAGRADAEGDRVLVDRVDVALLVERLRADRAAAVAQDVEAQHVGRPLGGLGAQHGVHPLDGLGREALTGADDRDQLVEEPLGEGDLAGLAAHRDPVAADVDLGVEGALDDPEELVAGAEQADHVDAVGDDDRVLGRGSVSHGGPGGLPFRWCRWSVVGPFHATGAASRGPASCAATLRAIDCSANVPAKNDCTIEPINPNDPIIRARYLGK